MRDSKDPSDKGPEGVRPVPTRAEGARSLYVINLTASNMPMPLEMPEIRGFFGLAVFRSRRLEDGRDRYRLHLGYFDSRADAERALPDVQRRYPQAWIAAAPRTGLGSLDDTDVSEFRLLHSPARAAATDGAHGEAGRQPGEVPVAAPQRYVAQLVWSDQRIDPGEIPQLAIYDAYTLYTVTLLRGGQRLYGVRLGFFTSVISARQIALYMRSEFPGIAVVPISNREYDVARTIAWHREARAVMGVETGSAPAPEPPPSARATATPREAAREDAAPAAAPMPERVEPTNPGPGKLAEPTQVPQEPPPAIAQTSEPAAAPGLIEIVSAKLVKSPTPTPTMVAREEPRKRRAAFSREELLAALGADELTLPRRRRDPITEPGVAYPGVGSAAGVSAPRRESRLGRLLHRLTNRHR
jgi:hypothetical protein